MLQGSTEYLHIPIGGPDANTLTADQIEVAVRASDADDYVWHPVDSYAAGVARYLVGPTSPHGTLPKGNNRVFVRVTDSPEMPVMAAGAIYIT